MRSYFKSSIGSLSMRGVIVVQNYVISKLASVAVAPPNYRQQPITLPITYDGLDTISEKQKLEMGDRGTI